MSLRCAREPGNLLTRLYRLARRQQENFVTESFTHLLHHLCYEHPDLGSQVLEWLAGEGFLSERVGDAPLRIRTQLASDEFGIPDIRIQADDLDVIVEVKLGGGISYGQLDAYRRDLEATARERRALVALLGFRPGTEVPEGTRIRTWGELSLFLSEQTKESGSEVTRRFVKQLAGLLHHLGLTPLEVRSEVSARLREHLEWAQTNPDGPALTRTRVRSLRLLEGMVGCGPLLNLLLQMQHVLSHAEGVRVYRLDSGYSKPRPWIGFNVNDMEFFFFLWLESPETLVVQRYKGGVDPASFDGSLGELDSESDGTVRWLNRIDLQDPAVDFFEKDRAEQVTVIADFFRQAFRFGRSLRSEPGADDEEEVGA